jgi:phosphopentomutase
VKGGASGEEPRDFGVRSSFADVGATVAPWLEVEADELPGEGVLR